MKITKTLYKLLIALLMIIYQPLTALAAKANTANNSTNQPTHLLGLLFPVDKQIIYEQYFEKFLKVLSYAPYVIVLGVMLGIGYWGIGKSKKSSKLQTPNPK